MTKSLGSTGLKTTEWNGLCDVAKVISSSSDDARTSNIRICPSEPAVANNEEFSGIQSGSIL